MEYYLVEWDKERHVHPQSGDFIDAFALCRKMVTQTGLYRLPAIKVWEINEDGVVDLSPQSFNHVADVIHLCKDCLEAYEKEKG